MARPSLSASVLPPLRRIRRRMRAQAALDGAARAAVPAASLALIAVYLWRLGVLGSTGLLRAALAGAGAIAAGALWGALGRISFARAAKRADVSHALDDRLGSALAFLDERAPTPFMLAAIDDAARHASRVVPKRAAPFLRPAGLGAAALVLAVAGFVALLRFPERAHVLAPPPPSTPHLVVDHDLLAPERQAAAELEREAERGDDPATKELADQLKQLLDQLDAEALTRKQVFDKLAEIEKQLKPQDGNFEELERALQKAGAELGKEKLTREAGQALAKEDLDKAKQELEKLAAEAERLDKQKKPDEGKRDELARSLKRAADAAAQPPEKSAEQKKREQEEQRLKEEQRRLQKQLAERPNDRELQRRLQRNQRELQRLEREKQQRAEQQRQLQRLQRELQQAAEQLRQKLSPEAAEALRRAAQQLGQMENEIRKLGNMSKAQVQIAELKEILRRAGSQQGQNGQPQSGQGQQANSGRDGRGQNGQGGQNGKDQNGKGGAKSLLRDFNNRAGGEKTLILGEGNTPVLLPLPMGPGGEKPGPQGQGGQGEQLPGDGIGDEHDPNLIGDPTKLASKRHDTRVEGKDAAGPSRSETILGSAERGFSTKAYRRVYSDYTSVMEEVMSKERVPPGYRFYIKRYFQLIKPRD
ncbi:MAG TPA: hypothetical protein VFF06_13790 [Polyangia bacterium]|nr:hypothetical protein [Polyangia bacterium]